MKLKKLVAVLSFGAILILAGYIHLSNIIISKARVIDNEDGNGPEVSLKKSHGRSKVGENTIVNWRSLLNDQTLDWDATVNREWLSLRSKSNPPPAMLLLTTYGWNHHNQTFGRDVFRNIRSRELVNGVINHPWFHPTAWQDINSGKMALRNSTRYYVFLDKHSCGEKNYPKYGKGLEGVFLNRDDLHGRGRCCLDQKNHFTSEVMESRAMSGNSIFVLFDCSGHGPVQKPEFKRDRRRYSGNKLAFVSVSSVTGDLYPDHDQGLVPPALLRCNDTVLYEQDSCKPRPIRFSFAGKINRAAARLDLETISNGQDVLVGGWEKPPIWMNMDTKDMAQAFLKLASLSTFGGTPRGKLLAGVTSVRILCHHT